MAGRYDKLLVLDLDETLIHTIPEWEIVQVGGDPDFDIAGGFLVYERPTVRKFLASCLARFRAVGIWTAGTRDYAMEVLQVLCDPDDLAFVWGRERCGLRRDLETHETHWVKDIRKLRKLGYVKSQILCVDDTPENFRRSYGNYVYVSPFEGDPEDVELEMLGRYLDELGLVPNVRSVEKRGWQRNFRR